MSARAQEYEDIGDVDAPIPAFGFVRMKNTDTGKEYWARSDGRSMRQMLDDPDVWAEGQPPVGHA